MKGNVWNESRVYQDPVTLRTVRQITTAGIVNTIPSYHTNQSFSESGEEVIFITARQGKSILCKANLLTGDITALIDPVDGIGGINEIGRFGDGKGIPIGPVLAPKSRWAYYIVERQIRAVHIDSLEEKVIVEGVPEDYFIESLAISSDEKNMIYAVDVMNREKVGGLAFQIILHPLHGGESRVILERKGIATGHLMFNPVDPDLFIFNMDIGPSCAHKVDEHSRSWIYRISDNSMTNIETVEPQNFQTHVAWTWDGRGVVYHGIIANSAWENNICKEGWYIGLAGLDGKPIREYSFPNGVYYGHVSAPVGKNAVILDGNLMEGMLMWLYFDEEKPKVEIIARHDTDFTTMPSQYPHPHAISDPSGRWIVFNSARRVIFTGARSDIYAVEL